MTFLRVNEQGYKEYKNEKDGSVLIYIPAGEFTMGSNDNDDEKPIHKVYLDAYYMDKYEVTVGQFREFCNATGRSMPDQPSWNRPAVDSFQDEVAKYEAWLKNHCPVVGVFWEDASAYASWAGKRLPTEAEWEKAARGTDGRKYPWGNKWNGSYCNHGSGLSPDSTDGYEYTAPVGCFPQGTSLYGVMDMAGNVWEWCADWYYKDYYQNSPSRNPTGPSFGLRRVVRGGSWYDTQNLCRAANRLVNGPQGFYDGSVSFSGGGFRCVR